MNEQNNPQSVEPIQNHKNNWILVILIILTALIVGGAIYVWQDSKIKSAEQSWQQQVSVLQDKINQLQQAQQNQNQQIEILTEDREDEQSADYLTKAQLLKQKFSLDILRFWNVRKVLQYPQNPNIFVYISEDSSGQNIWKFDASKDENYLHDEYPSIQAYNKLLLNVKVSSDNEFRGVGFDGSKFIFTETNKMNSPGVCFSPWLYDNLSYIDINTSQITRQPYTISNQKLQQVQSEAEECQENL